MNQLLHTLILAALEAGKVIMTVYENDDFDVNIKAYDSPVTKADLAANDIITRHLDATGIPILSEEGRQIPYEERKDWKYLWIVDPLDGTKEFIKRNDEFTVNIALVENGVPILGVVYAPALNEMYYSSRENGSFKTHPTLNSSLKEILSSSIQLPLPTIHTSYRIVASRSHPSAETRDFIEAEEQKHEKVELISKGSSLKLCMVAEGTADCYPRFAPTMEWDTAAGQAICLYAGAEVIDLKRQAPMRYNRENLLNDWFIVRRKTKRI